MIPAFRWLIPLFLLVSASARTASAQLVGGYQVETFTTNEGLPSQAITEMVRTTDGYLWLAAGGILVRFDGYEFRSFTAADAPALSRRVMHLHAGLGDTLWIVDVSNAVLALARGKVTVVEPPSGRILTTVAQDADGTLYGFGDRVWRLRHRPGESDEAEPRFPLAPRFASDPAYRVVRDSQGRLWSVDSSLAVRQVGAARSTSRRTGPNGEILPSPDGGVPLTIRERGDFREIQREDGYVVAAYRETRLEPKLPALVDHDGMLWVRGKRDYEVYERGRTDPVARIRQRSQWTSSTMIDGGAGCVWVAEQALRKICRVPFRITSGRVEAGYLVGATARAALIIDSSGVTLIRADSTRRELAAGNDGLRYATAYVDRQGVTWWSLNPLRTVRNPADTISRRLLPHGGVYRFADHVRHDGVVWYAASHSVYRVELPRTGPARVTDSASLRGRVTALAGAADGSMWAITGGEGNPDEVLQLRDGHVTRYTARDGIPREALRAVLADNDGTVWFGTYGGGLVRFRDGRFRAVSAADGLCENIVTSVLDDGAGNLWMSGNLSIHRVSRRDVDNFLDGRVRHVSGVCYRQSDGLPLPETVGFPGVRDASGLLWFPTLTGVAVVDPRVAVALDSIPPQVHILALETDRDTIDGWKSSARLKLGARRVTIRYTGIAPRNSERVHYEYRVDGIDDRWIDAGRSRVATYNNVGAGTYRVHVRAINSGGVRSRSAATMAFIVPPYVYETPAFAMVVAVAIGGTLLLLFRYRERHVRSRASELTRAVEERTASLQVALRTVADQSDRLRSLDAAKSRFFANVSHEFRTPLSLIIGPVDDLREGRAGELTPVARRRVDAIRDNATRLTQLVEQLLDVARLESGTMQLRAEVQDLVPLLRRIAESFVSLAEHRQIEFRLSCPIGALRVRHDPDMMEKVIGNLVGNALKFTPANGRIELRLAPEVAGMGASAISGTALIEVHDSGPGIAPEFHTRVFERFFQVDDSSRRSHEGVGIGLALVRELVELHGGTVSLRSSLGRGSTFTVRLPCATDGAPRAAEYVMAAPDSNGRPSGEAVAPAVAVPERDVTTILVVEDNADLLEFLRERLTERYHVLVAANGAQGLEMARHHVPDLIISDVMMPEMDGRELCKAVKSDPEIGFIPVILLTAKASRDSRLAGLTDGADDYLTKPVDMGELLIRAENLIASRRGVRERYSAAGRALPSINVAIATPPRDASSRALLESFRAVLGAHLADEHFDIDAMASAMSMSRTTLYRKLEPLLGQSPMDALWEYRLSQAAQWLAESSITVSEVAYGVGFKSVPHFSARFRERFSETPSAYRRATRPAPSLQ